MTNVSTSIVAFLLCAGCVVPYKAKSDTYRYNDATLEKLANKDLSESVYINSNSINNDLSTNPDATKSTNKDFRNHWISSGEFYSWKPIGNVEGYVDNYIALFEKFKRQKSRRESGKVDKNYITEVYSNYKNFNNLPEGHHEETPGILESAAFQAKVKLGESCEYSIQCPKMSGCLNGTCDCMDGYVNNTDACVKKRKDECYNDTDCQLEYLKYSYCVLSDTRNFCLCPSGYVAGRTECLLEVNPGDSCNLTIQCLSGSVCINETCVCKSDYTTEGSVCVKPRLGSCNELDKCPQNGECINGSCVCSDGYTKRHNECVKETKNVCYNNNDCQEFWGHTTCVTKESGNECQCKFGYVPGYPECLPERKVGESCLNKLQCHWKSECRLGFCECHDLFIRKGDECVRRELGDSCDLLYFCPPYSDCIGGICACQDYRIDRGGNCVKSKVGDSCNQTRECPQWGLCHDSTCVCQKDYDKNGDICVSKFVGGLCEQTEECPLRGFCNAGKCHCKSSYVMNGLVCVTPPSGTPKWIWAVVVAAVGVVIICISTIIIIVIIVRRNRKQAKRNGLHQTEQTASTVVESRRPLPLPPS